MAKILIAEDERDIRDLITFTLRFAGHEVVATSNGEEAYLKAQEVIPDLILMDVRMPRMTGYEACERMKQIEALKPVPVVFLSAKGQESEVQAGLNAGAVEYILKPFAPDQLTNRINALLEKYPTGPAAPAVEPLRTPPPFESTPTPPPPADRPTPPATAPTSEPASTPHPAAKPTPPRPFVPTHEPASTPPPADRPTTPPAAAPPSEPASTPPPAARPTPPRPYVPTPEPASTPPPAVPPTPPASQPDSEETDWPGTNLEERLGLDPKPEDEEPKDDDADPFRRFSG